MFYTIGEMANLLGVAPSTLRYYDKEGLLPFVERTEGGIRMFSEKDFASLSIINCLKQTGMSIKDIKSFMDMVARGDESIDDRLQLFVKQKTELEKQLQELEKTLEIINYKCWYYETAKKAGSTAYVDSLKNDEIPEKYAKIRDKMNGFEKNIGK
jgi:DNA-binding transcriptional MerR regulator